MGALIDWLGGKAQIGVLNALSWTPGGLTKEQQAQMDGLHKQYGMTEGEYEDNAAAKNRKEHHDDRSRAGLLEKAHAARPDLNDPGLLLAYVKQSSPDDYNRLIAPMLAKAPEGKMTYSYPHPEQVGPTQQLAPQNVTWSIHSVIVQAENALGFTKSLSDEAAKHGDTLASSQLNFSLPAGMRP